MTAPRAAVTASRRSLDAVTEAMGGTGTATGSAEGLVASAATESVRYDAEVRHEKFLAEVAEETVQVAGMAI